MIYFVVLIVLGFEGVKLVISLVNLVFQQRFGTTKLANQPLVSILIPARNEQRNIANILNDLTTQQYQNVEILVYDDQSQDNTAQIVEQFAQQDNRITLISGNDIDRQWVGKTWACYNLSQRAKGQYMLFVDADVRLKNSIIEQSVKYMQDNRLTLLSIFPRQIMATKAEKKTVPLMNYILLTMLPLVLVRRSDFSSLAAANGQFMLFEAQTYRTLNPHYVFCSSLVEDIQIARFYKRNKQRIACLVGKKDVQCRMYTNYEEAIDGFAKNVAYFFGNSNTLALIYAMLSSLGAIAVVITLKWYLILFYLVLITLSRVFVSLSSNQSISDNLLYAVHQMFSLYLIIFRSIANKRKKIYSWKGRKIIKN